MSENSAPAHRRPVLVTIAVVLVYVSGLTSTAVGILILLSRYRVDDDERLPVSLLGAAVILFGLLTIAVASGVSRGSGLGRLLVTIYIGAELILHVVSITTTDSWDWTSAVIIAVQLFILTALWAPPGAHWFRSAEPAQVVDVVTD